MAKKNSTARKGRVDCVISGFVKPQPFQQFMQRALTPVPLGTRHTDRHPLSGEAWDWWESLSPENRVAFYLCCSEVMANRGAL